MKLSRVQSGTNDAGLTTARLEGGLWAAHWRQSVSSKGPLCTYIKMPAGVSWFRYLTMLGTSILTMFAGAEVVHRYYRPDLSIPEIPPKPGELKTEFLGLKDEIQTHNSQKH